VLTVNNGELLGGTTCQHSAIKQLITTNPNPKTNDNSEPR